MYLYIINTYVYIHAYTMCVYLSIYTHTHTHNYARVHSLNGLMPRALLRCSGAGTHIHNVHTHVNTPVLLSSL